MGSNLRATCRILPCIIFFLLAILLLVGCGKTAMTSAKWEHDLQAKLAKYRPLALEKLGPYFRRAGVAYPPQKIAFLVFKNVKKLELWADSGNGWRYIRTFPVLAASGGPGPKLHSGDRQVPEGVYGIKAFNPDSNFLLSMQVSYPDEFDRHVAEEDGRSNLGGDIFIHGNHRSIGCIAIGDNAIEQLFVLANMVGLDDITVIIAPNDFRKAAPILGKERPAWLGELYQSIGESLSQFKR